MYVQGESFTQPLRRGFLRRISCFTGTADSSEIEMGVGGVGRFIVDNLDELDLLSEISRRFRRRVHVQITSIG